MKSELMPLDMSERSDDTKKTSEQIDQRSSLAFFLALISYFIFAVSRHIAYLRNAVKLTNNTNNEKKGDVESVFCSDGRLDRGSTSAWQL